MLAVEHAAERRARDAADRAPDDGAAGAAVVDRPSDQRAGARADQAAGAGPVRRSVEIGAGGDVR
jgi:hypothetical protein